MNGIMLMLMIVFVQVSGNSFRSKVDRMLSVMQVDCLQQALDGYENTVNGIATRTIQLKIDETIIDKELSAAKNTYEAAKTACKL